MFRTWLVVSRVLRVVVQPTSALYKGKIVPTILNQHLNHRLLCPLMIVESRSNSQRTQGPRPWPWVATALSPLISRPWSLNLTCMMARAIKARRFRRVWTISKTPSRPWPSPQTSMTPPSSSQTRPSQRQMIANSNPECMHTPSCLGSMSLKIKGAHHYPQGMRL